MGGVYSPEHYKQHALPPAKGEFIPRTWLFTDTETSLKDVEGGQAHFFAMGWTCLWLRSWEGKKDHYDWQYFDGEKKYNEYLQFIALNLTDVHLVGHNIYFDLQACGFFHYFTRWGWDLKFYYDKGLTYILKCSLRKSTLTVVSTTNWFDQSLKKLGDTLGLPKLDVTFGVSTPDEMKRYCHRDVEIVIRAVKEYITFIQANKLGRFSLTKASQAFNAYRHRFMEEKIYLHRHPDVLALEREAYMGARTEAFFIGECKGGPFVTLDVNSMYPYVMKRFTYPKKLIRLYSNIEPGQLKDTLKTLNVIAYVKVSTDEPAFAVKHKGKTVFPVGDFNCYLCTEGLKYALSRGYLVHIHRAAVYQGGDLFTAYVDYFHDLRVKYKKEGNDIFALLCKYMHNSLYGKFGQLGIKTLIEEDETGRTYLREDIPNVATGKMVVVTHLMNRKITTSEEGEGKMSNVAIAAHVTENARFVLWEYMKKAGRGNVLYCDTDSLKLRVSDLKKVTRLVDPNLLGMLKVESRDNKLWIEGAKNYRTVTYRKIKGIPRKAVEISPGTFTFESFVRQVTHLRGGVEKGVMVRTITRRLKATYDKARVLRSGRVVPFTFPL